MEYSIQGLASLAGVSTRTLRYYDKIGLLLPAGKNSSGYRVYGPAQVDTLQEILFYRELGLSLDEVRWLLQEPGYNRLETLKNHRVQLVAKQQQLELLIANVDKTINAEEGGFKLTDQEKFEGLKRRLVQDNENKYGSEARARWGNQAVDDSNAKLMGMSQEKFQESQRLAAEIIDKIHQAMVIGDPASPIAQEAADLHRQWLMCYWDKYNKETHAGLAQMYVDDERFTAFYDQQKPGTAQFLRDAILVYTGS